MQRIWLPAGAAILLPLAGTIAGAGDAHLIDARIANFREIGTAFKQVNDELKSKRPDLVRIRESACLINDRGAEIPRWFPPGSEPATPLEKGWLEHIRGWFGFGDTLALPDAAKTRAKIEVWTEPAQFKERYSKLSLEADKLCQAAQKGEIAVITERLRSLGKACKSCHEKFREEED